MIGVLNDVGVTKASGSAELLHIFSMHEFLNEFVNMLKSMFLDTLLKYVCMWALLVLKRIGIRNSSHVCSKTVVLLDVYQFMQYMSVIKTDA